MNDFDKIRILWIEDQVLQNRELLIDLEPYFELPFKNLKGENEPVKCINEYRALLAKDTIFPVEIVSADYDLSDCSEDDLQTLWENLNEEPDSKNHKIKIVSNKDINYAGFLIQTIHALHFKNHPTGIVSATSKGEAMKKSFDHVNGMLCDHYNADIEMARTDKSWRTICERGVSSLRGNIKRLYSNGEIIVSVSDLMKLAENPNQHEVLTIVSPFATRRLPIRGLFIDCDEEEQNDQIKSWTTSLLTSQITMDQLVNSVKLENEVWNAYNDDILVERMKELSRLYIDGDIESEKYNILKDQFNLTVDEEGYNQCNANWCDIRHGDYTIEERRWAALFLIRRLFKRIILFIKNLEIKGTATFGETSNAFYPAVDKYDILLLLFPIPKTPFPLPWFISDSVARANAFGGWQDHWMPNNLGFKPSQILKGDKITSSERQVLQSFAISEDKDLGETPGKILAAWKSYEPAKLFMFGKEEE